MIIYKHTKQIDQAQLLNLYNNAGWIAYTKNPDELYAAIQNSLTVITAWQNNNLVGLTRAVGDGCTILYIQDLLVHSNYRRQGIGSKLLKQIVEMYPTVRRKILLTDDTSQTRQFYSVNGFTSCDDGKLVAFTKK